MLRNLRVPKGISVVIPVYNIHRDRNIWPEPEKFHLERSPPPGAKQSRDPYAYMPFGHGPRNCMGMRFAEMNLRLARLLKKYNFEVAADIEIPPKVFLRGTLVAKEMKLKINGK